MRNENSQFAKKYALGFALFCLLAAVLTILLAALVYRLEERVPTGDGVSAPTVSEQQANSITVVIDAGHGGEDGGAVGVCGAIEKDLNLEISKLLADMLRANVQARQCHRPVRVPFHQDSRRRYGCTYAPADRKRQHHRI